MICVDDILVWECLEDRRVVKIAQDLGYNEEMDWSEYEKIRKKQNEILKKHGLNSENCWFDKESLGEEDYKKYILLQNEGERFVKALRREEVDKCIDWLMDNGFALKVVKITGE